MLIDELVDLVILTADNLLKTNVLMEEIVVLKNEIANWAATSGWYKFCRDGDSGGLALGPVCSIGLLCGRPCSTFGSHELFEECTSRGVGRFGK